MHILVVTAADVWILAAERWCISASRWDDMQIRTDRAEEITAREIVGHALTNASLERHDDGRQNGMVDALITFEDGRVAALGRGPARR